MRLLLPLLLCLSAVAQPLPPAVVLPPPKTQAVFVAVTAQWSNFYDSAYSAELATIATNNQLSLSWTCATPGVQYVVFTGTNSRSYPWMQTVATNQATIQAIPTVPQTNYWKLFLRRGATAAGPKTNVSSQPVFAITNPVLTGPSAFFDLKPVLTNAP